MCYIGQEDPQWASVSNAVFLCASCAALHRQLGVYYSSVRSLTMDPWGEKALKMMTSGGNKHLYDYFKQFDLMEATVDIRYKT